MRRQIITFAAVFGCAAGLGFSVQAAKLPTAPMSTPVGVTFGDVIGFDGRFLWRYLTTDQGKPLYTFDADGDSGKSTCTDECAKEFVPYLAKPGEKAAADWSLVTRGPKEQQWAFRGHPVYSFSGKDPVPVNPNAGQYFNVTNAPYVFDPRMVDPSSNFFSPKKGWRRAEFAPDKASVPSGIEAKSVGTASGYILTDANTEMPLYVLATPPKNPKAWTPMYAPDLAGPVGDFAVRVMENGRKQWTFKGSPLYSYKEDYSPDDLNGSFEQRDAQPALAYKNFMPSSVQINFVPLRGPIMMTTQGKTLYAESFGGNGGRSEKRDEAGGSYAAGKAMGTKGCVDECLKTWEPLLATAQDKASGFWDVYDRPDGTRQWAYRGSALYTYVGDRKPGDLEGNGKRIIVYGDPDGKNADEMALTGGNRGGNVRTSAGSGLNWHIVGIGN